MSYTGSFVGDTLKFFRGQTHVNGIGEVVVAWRSDPVIRDVVGTYFYDSPRGTTRGALI